MLLLQLQNNSITFLTGYRFLPIPLCVRLLAQAPLWLLVSMIAAFR